MSKKIEGGKKITITNSEKLNNASNLGNLSDELVIDADQQAPNMKLPQSSSLQIQSVVSLSNETEK